MKILFVCTGNTCRSPLAEAFMNHIASSHNRPEVSSFSRGLASYDEKASEKSLMVAKERGIDISSHISRQLTIEDIEESDLVLTMTKDQSEFLKLEAKKFKDKIFSLSEYTGCPDVSDPYGGDYDTYRKCADDIWDNCEKILEKIPEEK